MNSIPAMTDPMSRHWVQPSVDDIEIDDTHALMTESVFNRLTEYSRSFPSGVYEGKMWKSQSEDDGKYYLLWFGKSFMPDSCSNNYREILIVKE